MTKHLENRVAVITGAGRGIGRAVALEFARQGASVVVNDLGVTADGDRDPNRAQMVVNEIEANGGTAVADTGDVSDQHQAERMVDLAIERFGQLDALVNNAGNAHLGTVLDTSPEDFDAIMRVHVRGYFNTTRRAAQYWAARNEYGRLINFVSMAAIASFPSLYAYSVAKSAILGMTRSCANALVSYRVTANAIRPNAATGMSDQLSGAARERGVSKNLAPASEHAAGTMSDPAHIAPMCVYLASPSSAHVSGRLLEARGGHYALWSEPQPERTLEINALESEEDTYSGIEEMLSGLSLKDLKLPMPPLSQIPDWKTTYGTMVPRWDFNETPGKPE